MKRRIIMNSLTRIMSYDKTKINQENCNCEECVSVKNVESDNQITEYPKLSDEEIEQIIFERYSDKDDKTKIFIRKALIKHGDRYDYSKTIYVKAREKVEIICKVEGHSSFWQTPEHHLRGRGCQICGGSKRLTLEEFIEKSNLIQGKDRYDYSESEYINNRTLIKIICPKEGHGEFWQSPYFHMAGGGCPKCANERKRESNLYTLEEFIEISNNIHGVGTYDYSNSIYIDSQSLIEIICPKHGSFWQLAGSHMQGHGCPKCGFDYVGNCNKLTTEEFIEKSNYVQGEGRYDYSNSVYVDSDTPIEIICSKHGSFWQLPYVHMNGSGCPKCKFEKLALTLEEFIEKANEKQGEGRYDYSESKYIDSKTPLKIICPKHGAFWQTPNAHLRRAGCPICNESQGSKRIRIFLSKNNIVFEQEKRFNDCRNIYPLPFDFYLPQYNLCIEFDGSCHFKKTNWNGEYTEEQLKENLESYQHRDQIKNDYCKSHNITLLRFNNLKTVEEELMKYFQEHGIIKEEGLFDLVS